MQLLWCELWEMYSNLKFQCRCVCACHWLQVMPASFTAKCSLDSFSKDESKECSPSHSPEQPMECLSSSSSSSQWKHFTYSGSHKRRHVPRGRQSRLRSPSPKHSSSSKDQSHSPRWGSCCMHSRTRLIPRALLQLLLLLWYHCTFTLCWSTCTPLQVNAATHIHTLETVDSSNHCTIA